MRHFQRLNRRPFFLLYSLLLFLAVLLLPLGEAEAYSFNLPANLKRIESQSFANIIADEVVIPTSVTYIADDAFSGTNFTAVVYRESYAYTWCLEHNIPWKYYESSASLFTYENTDNGILINKYNGTEHTVVVPQTIDGIQVVAIGEDAFADNTSIVQVYLPDGLQEVGISAFKDCTALQSIYIPDSVTMIGRISFNGCRSLKSFRYPLNLEGLSGPYYWSGPFNSECTSLKKVIVPEGVTVIPDDFFSNAVGLTEVVLPSTLTEIGRTSFVNCNNLTQINIPDSVTIIGSYAFSGCEKLASFHYPLSLTSTGSLGQGIFDGCTMLKEVTVPEGIEAIPDQMFYGSSVVKVNLPSTLKTIGAYAFLGCTKLTTITPPSGLEAIGTEAFNNCSALNFFRYPASLKRTGSGIFIDCASLKSVTVPSGVELLPAYVFNEANYLEEVSLPNTLKSISDGAFGNCVSLRTVNIPDSVIAFGHYVFMNCPSLQTLYISNSVTGAGDGVFDSCTALTVYCPAGSYIQLYCADSGVNWVAYP